MATREISAGWNLWPGGLPLTQVVIMYRTDAVVVQRELSDWDLEGGVGCTARAPINTTLVQPTQVFERTKIIRERELVPVPVPVPVERQRKKDKNGDRD